MAVAEPRWFAHRTDQESVSAPVAQERDSRRPVDVECLPAWRHHRVLARLPPIRRCAAFRVPDEQRSARLHGRSLPRRRETGTGTALPGLPVASLRATRRVPELLAGETGYRKTYLPGDAGQRRIRPGIRTRDRVSAGQK